MKVNWQQLTAGMIHAAVTYLNMAPDQHDNAAEAVKRLKAAVDYVQGRVDAGLYTPQQAIASMKFERAAIEAWLAGKEAQDHLSAQQALKAAIDVASQAINTAIGFVLL